MDEFERRYKAAKASRTKLIEDEGFEVYKFCFNGREDEWLGHRGRSRDPEEIFADCVATVAEDFGGDLFHTMTPENTPWVEYEAGSAIDEDQEGAVKEFIESREKAISKALKSSNYYDEAPTAFQDASFGNVALWMDRYTMSDPITCEAVPSSELHLRLGPFGIDDRFRTKKYYYSDLPELFPGAEFKPTMADKIKNSPGKATVVRGFWLNFEDSGNPVWHQAIRVDNEDIGLDKDLGPWGSCPLIVGRFNPTPNSPWGRGPARRMLPTLRTLDELVRMNLESMDHTLDPSIIYPNDGILDLSDGLESGMGYPAMPGTAESIREIGGGQLDYGFFAEEKIEQRVREGFYRHVPQQGKTPPSASQYMGDEQKEIRRMARGSGKLWKEFGVSVLRRVEYLETQTGGSLDGEDFEALDGKIITLRPISPLERAQAREEVLVAQSIMAMAAEGLGPEQAAVVIDGPVTMRKIKKTLKDNLVEFRTEEQIQKIMQMAQQQQQGVAGEQAQ